MRKLLILVWMLLLASPVLAAVRWGVYFNGCDGP